MGLDMYLHAKRHLRYNEEDAMNSICNALDIDKKQVSSVTIEAMYWRKANQIHRWFVENVQGGRDDCATYHVSREKLKDLRQLLVDAIENKNCTLLPTQSGFFFGSVDIDEYYWEVLESTEEELTEILNNFPEDKWQFEYYSSW